MTRRDFLLRTPAALALTGGLSGCISPEMRARMEDPANEGRGLWMSGLPVFLIELATYEPSPQQVVEVEQRAEKVTEAIAISPSMKQKEDIIVVEVSPKEETFRAPEAKAAVMLWDTKAEEIIGNKVYEIGTSPKVGSVVKWDTHTVQYFGRQL